MANKTLQFFKKFFTTSILLKLTLAAAASTVIAVLASAWISFNCSRDLLIKSAVSSMEASMSRQVERLERSIHQVRRDALLVSHSDAVKGFIRAMHNQGYDQKAMTSQADWRSRLESIFSVMIETKGYQRISLVRLKGWSGELVRVDRSGDGVLVQRGEELRAGRALELARQGAKLKPDQTYVSEIKLTREKGRIQKPRLPSQDFVAPVFSPCADGKEGKTPCGVVIITTDAGQLMSGLETGGMFEVVLANSKGGYLRHPDPKLAWGFEFGRKGGLAADMPRAWHSLRTGSQGVVWNDQPGDEVYVVGRVPLGLGQGSNFLALVMIAKESRVLAEITGLKWQMLLIAGLAILVSILLSLLFLRRMARPIRILTRQADQLASGREAVSIRVASRDEVGRLGRSLSNLVEKLQSRGNELELTNLMLKKEMASHRKAEQALKESEERYREFVEGTDDLVVRMGPDGNFVYVSHSAEKVLGAKPEELIGKTAFGFIHPDDRRRTEHEFAGWVADHLESASHECRMVSLDGRVMDMLWSINLHYDSQGKVAAANAIARDITERKQAQRELRQAHAKLEERVKERTAELETLNRGLLQEITERTRVEDALKTSEQRYQSMVSVLAEAIILLDRQGNIMACNPQAEEMLGVATGQVVTPQDFERRWRPYREDGSPLYYKESPIAETFNTGRPIFEVIHGGVKPDGSYGWFSINTQPLTNPGKELPHAVVASFSDVTQRREFEQQQLLVARMFENSIEGIIIADENAIVRMVNPAVTAITGYQARELTGRVLDILRSGGDDMKFLQKLWEDLSVGGRWSGEYWNRRKSGEIYPEWLTINVLKNAQGKVINYLVVFHDITEIKQSQERIAHLAMHDALTGLPNRLLLEDRLTQALARGERNREKVALLYVDLDNFKNINDSLGHAVGDELLKEVAGRFMKCVREQDTVARMGGDEFLMVLTSVNGESDAVTVSKRVLGSLARPFFHEGNELHVTASVGITMFPRDGADPGTLIKNADMAMYKAKDQGKNNFERYTRSMDLVARKRLDLESSLRKALRNQEFVVYYQPKVDLASGAMAGVEALIRWDRPGVGIVLPGQFIPLAEDTGLIAPIGEWVLEMACRQMRKWHSEFGSRLTVAVNLSARQFQQPGLVRFVRQTLNDSGLNAASLQLEVTESMVMQNVHNAIDAMQRLKELGLGISMDDFGTGYSSLSQLKRFPLDELKIDKSFVDHIPYEPEEVAITRTTIAMAHSLNLKVVAEGVETPAQLNFLREEGCDLIQGYLYSKPLHADEFSKLLSEDKRI